MQYSFILCYIFGTKHDYIDEVGMRVWTRQTRKEVVLIIFVQYILLIKRHALQKHLAFKPAMNLNININ